MLTVYTKEAREEWNRIVKSFANRDVYYLYEYAYSFMLHGDGEPYLIYFSHENERLCYVVMKRDIADCAQFVGLIEKGQFYDFTTPYGYGGPITDVPLSTAAQSLFEKELFEYCVENHIVTQFIRFHPLLRNFEIIPKVIETRYIHDTIYIDTSVDSELIMKNMDSKNRNMIRKAQKSGVNIVRKAITDIDEFLPMYEETMRRNNADDYYFFTQDYYKSLSALSDNACIFYALFEGKPISGAIMYYNDKYMHYHLSGTYSEYRNLAAGNLLLYEAACAACEMGISAFHLGGGVDPEDSLFGFKKQFNKNGRIPFVVGRTIFDSEKYNELLSIRASADSTFDANNNFMIQYLK